MGIPMETIDALRAKFDALLPHLDERAQRLTLGAEARSRQGVTRGFGFVL